MKTFTNVSIFFTCLILMACENPANENRTDKTEGGTGSVIHGEWDNIGRHFKGAVYVFNFPNRTRTITASDGRKGDSRFEISQQNKHTLIELIYSGRTLGTRYVMKILNNDLIHLFARGDYESLDIRTGEEAPVILQRRK